MTKTLIVLALAGVSFSHIAAAQNQSVLAAGTRVRLVSPALESTQQIGKVVSATADTIVFRADVYPVTRTIPMSAITSMEVSAGQVSGKRRFGLIGLAIGGVIGFAANYHATGRNGSANLGGSRSPIENAFLNAGIGGALGGLAGWMVGRSHLAEKWISVPGRDR